MYSLRCPAPALQEPHPGLLLALFCDLMCSLAQSVCTVSLVLPCSGFAAGWGHTDHQLMIHPQCMPCVGSKALCYMLTILAFPSTHSQALCNYVYVHCPAPSCSTIYTDTFSSSHQDLAQTQQAGQKQSFQCCSRLAFAVLVRTRKDSRSQINGEGGRQVRHNSRQDWCVQAGESGQPFRNGAMPT